MNLRKTEVHVMSWLAGRPGSYWRGSWGPIERLLKRGLIEPSSAAPQHYQLTEAGKNALRSWSGTL